MSKNQTQFKLRNSLKLNSHKRILLLGLDNSGKTSILYRMNMGEFVLTTPTIGFNVESFKYKRIFLKRKIMLLILQDN